MKRRAESRNISCSSLNRVLGIISGSRKDPRCKRRDSPNMVRYRTASAQIPAGACGSVDRGESLTEHHLIAARDERTEVHAAVDASALHTDGFPRVDRRGKS